MTVVIATLKSWNIRLTHELKQKRKNDDFHIFTSKDELSFDELSIIKPDFIFFPHWSYIIPCVIYENYKCVVFHMTDLPFGRGGSPLQNLITRGVTETKISAIAITAEIDAGDIYMKEPLSLHGSAEEIYKRASEIIFRKMIPHILDNRPTPTPQVGETIVFERRTPEMSELSQSMTINQIYDYIRMLDAEGYPKAFLKFGNYYMRFTRAQKTEKGIITEVLIEENYSDDKH